jgi:hypothetical protein
MRKKIYCIMLFFLLLLLFGTAYAEMPLGFQMAMNNGGQKEVLCVKNYNTGATMTEAYTNFEQLDRNTEVRTRSYDSANSAAPGGGFLEASINSNVIGNAHIAWQSYDPQTDNRGRHQILGRSIEDLTGVFSIEKFIQLWSNSSPGEISIDWLPCS